MDATELIAHRLLHVAVLTVIAVLVIAQTTHLSTGVRLFVGTAPIVTWVMGKYYERGIVLQAELVDRDTLREVERDNARILFRN